MPEGQDLPKFRRPPVVEVVHGVQFAPLGWTITHPGQFHLTIAERFPRVQVAPPLPPVREHFGSPMLRPVVEFMMGDGKEMPRAWFASSDQIMLLQVQGDRFHLNWRKRGDGTAPDVATYPHFDNVSARFAAEFSEFARFAEAAGLGAIQPSQCELTYINHFPADESGQLPPLERLFNVWSGNIGREWPVPPEDGAFTINYVLQHGGAPVGRLHVVCSRVARPPGELLIQLELTARGIPLGPGFDGIRDFHSLAHDAIVRCFTALTSGAAHSAWERLQ